MIQDFRKIAPGESIAADLIIIGCGPVGISLAEEFERGSSRVVVIEGGGLKIEPALQALNEADVAGMQHTGHADGRARAVGGTGHLWAGQCLRLDPIDFELRPWVPHSGWPLDGASLAPFYDRAERFFGIPGAIYDDRNYTALGIAPPQWTESSLVNHFTLYTPELNTAKHHLGRLRRAPGLRLLTHANVVRIETEAFGDRVTGVCVRTLDGAESRIYAGTVVLAAGGIENARILLSSRNQAQCGIGNRHGLVGRFFQEHPNAITATIRPADLTSLQDCFRRFYPDAVTRFPKFALSPEFQRRHTVLNCNAHLVFDYPENSGLSALRRTVHAFRKRKLPDAPLRQFGSILRELDQVANVAVRRLGRGRSPIGMPTTVSLQCYLEQAPNAESRIRLADGLDRLGMPRLCVDWRVTDLERKTLHLMTELVGREFAIAGFGDVYPERWLEDDGDEWKSHLRDCSHHMGTTRMAASSQFGVVDSECRVFEVDGLYVAGTSVFPTSGYANPTLTAVALALRLADTLKRRISGTHAPAEIHTGGFTDIAGIAP